jgi:hypothetical protein
MIIKTLGEFREKYANLPDDTPLSVWDDKMFLYGDADIRKCKEGITFEFSYRPKKEEPKTADDITNHWSYIDRSVVIKEAKEIIRQLDPNHEHKPNRTNS